MTTPRWTRSMAILLLAAAMAPAQVLFHDEFNSNAAFWTLGPQWAIGPTVPSSCGAIGPGAPSQDPGSDADGKAGGGVAGVVLGGCTGTPLHGYYYLVSPPIDTTGSTSLRLEFDRHLTSDYPPYMDSVVDVWNGAAWINIFSTPYGGIYDSNWVHVSYNISLFSNPALRVRWGYASYLGALSVAGWSIDNVRVTNREYFFDRFRDNAAGWTLDQEWAIGSATASASSGSCGGFGDPGSDGDGTPAGGVAGVILGGNCAVSPHGYWYLTSPAVNTSGATQLALQYNRWLNADYSPYMHSTVDVWNGIGWINVFSTGSTCVVEGAWSTQSHDITSHSNAALKVRFGFDRVGASFFMSQWNIDNVSIHDPTRSCVLVLSAYTGPGSIRVSAHCLETAVPPGTTLFNCFTFHAGNYPAGYFFGIDPSLPDEVLPQFMSGALPFVGVTNASGDVSWSLPAGAPSGITVYGVTVAIAAGGYPAAASAPISFTTP